MEVYAEYSVPAIPKFSQLMLRNLLILMGILFFILSPTLYYTLVFSITCFTLAYYYNHSLRIDYEYIICNDEFHIDRIVNKNKRRKAYRLNLQFLEVFTDMQSVVDEYSRSKLRGRRVIRKNFRNPKYKPYLLVVHDADRTECVIINGSAELVQAFRQRYPQKSKLSFETLTELRTVEAG
ncbi:DUF6106 family protein [Allobaculum sp. JKK-2023]|uniref:DUF6106 family protein n=1 Tax=Allobaculum sp. JKK-2023 TaxID=3108943 RepID=UPI002B056004|nr:DUF6106 family protein [Allobaculum sp. JKK-2023]